MKIPTDNLFQLIHAMTASEKRYFKRHYSSEKSLTTELFDFINSQDNYNEGAVKKHFTKSKASKNLKVYKVQLTELLLKSLNSYHYKKTVRSKIRIGLEEVEILMDKQLFELGYAKLKKLKKLCIKYEEFSYIPSILVLEVQFNYFYSANKINQNEYLIEELNHYSDTLKNIFRLKQINLTVTSRHNHKLTQNLSIDEINFYETFLQKEVPNIDDNNKSFNERYYLSSAAAFIHNILYQDLEKEHTYKNKNIALFEAYPHFIQNHTRLYFATLFNNLSLSMSLGKTDELEEGILKVKELTDQYPFLKRNLLFVYFLETKQYFNKGDFQFFTEDYQKTVLRHIQRFQQGGDYLTVLIFIYFTISFMALGNSQKVHFYLRRLHLRAKHLDNNYGQFFNILDLISHYETSDYLVIQNLLASFKRKQKRSSNLSPFFNEMLHFFGEIIKSDSKTKVKSAQSMKEKAQKFTNDGVRNLLKVFILDDWLDAIIQNRSYIHNTRNNTFYSTS